MLRGAAKLPRRGGEPRLRQERPGAARAWAGQRPDVLRRVKAVTHRSPAKPGEEVLVRPPRGTARGDVDGALPVPGRRKLRSLDAHAHGAGQRPFTGRLRVKGGAAPYLEPNPAVLVGRREERALDPGEEGHAVDGAREEEALRRGWTARRPHAQRELSKGLAEVPRGATQQQDLGADPRRRGRGPAPRARGALPTAPGRRCRTGSAPGRRGRRLGIGAAGSRGGAIDPRPPLVSWGSSRASCDWRSCPPIRSQPSRALGHSWRPAAGLAEPRVRHALAAAEEPPVTTEDQRLHPRRGERKRRRRPTALRDARPELRARQGGRRRRRRRSRRGARPWAATTADAASSTQI